MGEYGKKLDAYLAAFEREHDVKLPIPEKLAKRKEVNDSIELKLEQQNHHLTTKSTSSPNFAFPPSESVQSSEVDQLSEIDQFDLDRIDQRLRALGVDPDALADDDDECETISLNTSDLSSRIQHAVHTQI